MFRRLVIASAFIVALGSSSAWASPIYSDVFFFGTSELDTGNWLLDPALSGDPVAPTAAKGYWNGRWQEGPAWSDYFAAALGHDATPSLAGGQNYAFGVAWLGPLPGDPAPTGYAAKTQLYFSSQITDALGDYGNVLPSDALYVVSIGSNDPGPFFNKPASEADDRAHIAVSQVQRLVDAGARNFLVQTLGGTDAYVTTYNQTLLAGLAAISGINVAIVDTRTFNQTVVLAPGFLAGLGITGPPFTQCNADPVCLGEAQAAAALGQPYLSNSHFRFDNVHRNTQVAEALAGYALSQIPEPGTMSLLTVGLGAALVWGRKRLGRNVRGN